MWKGLATARGVLEAGHTLVSTGRCCVAVTLFNRFWAQGQFPGPFVSVGTYIEQQHDWRPRGITRGWTNTRNRA